MLPEVFILLFFGELPCSAALRKKRLAVSRLLEDVPLVVQCYGLDNE